MIAWTVVPLRNTTDPEPIEMQIRALGRVKATDPPALIELDATSAIEAGMEPIQLLESSEYQLRLGNLPPGAELSTSHPDVVTLEERDDRGAVYGRLRPGLRTGLLDIHILDRGRYVGTVSMEVRSRKLDYLSQYQWMIRDIAIESVGLLLQDYAATSQRLAPAPAADPISAYQRLSLLRSLIEGPELLGALETIFASPHTDWTAEPQPGRFTGVTSADVLRQLVASPRRVAWPNSHVEGMTSLPTRVANLRPIETADTPPNRFVRFVLDNWLALIAEVHQASLELKDSASRERARRETEEFAGRIGLIRANPLFDEVSDLDSIPSHSQVLLRRPGYRELLRAYALVEAGVTLDWGVPETAFTAGQRDIAKLFEFWAYVWLRDVVARLCSVFDTRPLASQHELQGGIASARKGIVRRLGRSLELTLYYNRQFAGSGSEGWSTAAMRPDFSIQISTPEGWADDAPAWIHFDAKYRLEAASEVFPQDVQDDLAKREDILKMHAYRDAIRRSGGAYVIFPGRNANEAAIKREFTEVIPGLGAFALTPSSDGRPSGLSAIEAFLDEAFAHYASTVSRDRRARYWGVLSHSGSDSTLDAAVPGLPRPPADVLALLGYVRSPDRRQWIYDQRRYNVRAGHARGAIGLAARELGCEYVVLYGRGFPPEMWTVAGSPEIWTSERMLATGYPGRDPRAVYFCYPLGSRVDMGLPLEADSVMRWARARSGIPGQPVAVSILDLVQLEQGDDRE